MTVQLILPKGADLTDGLDHGLVTLTEAIAQLDGDKVAHGFLGGEFGYGGHWENEVFLMHPFCWCDREDCPWCMGCDCPDTSYHYFVDGSEVTYKEYSAFFERETGKHDHKRHDAWMKRAEAANARRTTRHDPVCRFCTGGLFPEKGAGRGKSAPNFWHKPTGLKVWWYKYIGRGMESEGLDGADLQAVFAECLHSLTHSNGVRSPE